MDLGKGERGGIQSLLSLAPGGMHTLQLLHGRRVRQTPRELDGAQIGRVVSGVVDV